MKKAILLAGLIICMLTSSLVGCGGDTATTGASDQPAPDWLIEDTDDHITLIDYAGREVTVSKPIERAIIISGAKAALGIVAILGAEDMIVAISDGQKEKVDIPILFPTLSQLPSYGGTSGGSSEVNYEKIIEYEPDVVIAWSFVPDEFNSMLEPEIPVVRLEFTLPLDDYYTDIEKLGYILDKQGNAAEFVDWCQDSVDYITDRVAGLTEEEKPRVFDFYGGDWGMTDGPPYGTYGVENYWVGPLIEMAGGNNISGDLPGDWITIDAEWMAEQNPEVVIREVCTPISGNIVSYATDDPTEVAEMRSTIMAQPEFVYTDAVVNDRFFMCDAGIIQNFWFIGLPYMAKWFHPDLFEDLDPQQLHQEYLDRFLGIDYDLDERGVFSYPNP